MMQTELPFPQTPPVQPILPVVDTATRRPLSEEEQADWFTRTGHCGACGDPGDYCTCLPAQPCGCSALHTQGSGLSETALNTFRALHAEQGDLW